MKRNPKQEGSKIFDAKVQVGECPLYCNQCFYNRPEAFYAEIQEIILPSPEEVGDGIVRVNCGHDSNFDKEEVIRSTRVYPRKFYNTSIPRFDFPAPVVFTANRSEEEPAKLVPAIPPNLMAVRLRVSTTNLAHVSEAIRYYASHCVPLLLTFMAYYENYALPKTGCLGIPLSKCYEWKVRHVNPYWCPTRKFMETVLKTLRRVTEKNLVYMCGTLDSNLCKDCGNCERLFNRIYVG